MANIEKLRKNLESRGFQTSYFDTAGEAAAYLNGQLDGETIGFGGSMTVQAMGLLDLLSGHNNCVPHRRGAPPTAELGTPVYISSVNGVAETGELINIDGYCNRVASGLCGPEKLYFIIGVNKIAPDAESALWRARNVAAPKNARRLGLNTPCAVGADRCYDCLSPDCICSAIVTYRKKPTSIPRAEVVIVNEELGF